MTQPVFDQIDAPTPDLDAIRAQYEELGAAYDAAADAAGRQAVLDRWEALRREVGTYGSLTSLRFSQDTRDADRKAALEQFHEMSPKFNELELAFMKRIADGPHREEVADRHGPYLLDLWACGMAGYDPVIEEEVIAESKLETAYTALLSSAEIEFRGETYNLSELRPFTSDKDRETRHAAMQAQWAWFEKNAAEFDRLYDELVKLRTTQAKKLGYDSYVELGYKKLRRTDYDRTDVERYRKAVLEHVVPLCVRIHEQQRETLGVDTLMAWDETVHDLAGNPKPHGTYDEKMTQARAMFDEMGDGLGSFFRLMDDGGFLDLEARKGKAGGGFCTSFATIGMPFIFANFNDTKGDVEVFTHEVGHAFQNYSSRGQSIMDYFWPTYDAAEIHSMSLEYLTWPHMEKFFGEDADRFRRVHLLESLLFLPYGVAVDHFQHMVYDNPDATPDERLAMWREVEALYMPWRQWGDLERPKAGARWQGQMHVYGAPFYYIDYTLAGVCAMQFWDRAEEDREAAMKDYVALCKRGGEAPFQALVRSAGIKSPLDDGCLERVVARASDYLGLSPATA